MAKDRSLEGPRQWHHAHGPDASVPHKGKGPAVPMDHWEKYYKYDPTAPDTPSGAFLPKCAKNRPQPHTKVNECDH